MNKVLITENNFSNSNYQKQITSLSAAFWFRPIVPRFFKSLKLIPEGAGWLVWIDGHGNKLKIDPARKKISSEPSNAFFSSDPYFYSSYQEISSRLQKTICILTDKNVLLFFSLDEREIFRSIVFNLNNSFHFSPLFFGYFYSLEIFSHLISDRALNARYKFSSPFGKMIKNFPSLAEAMKCLPDLSIN